MRDDDSVLTSRREGHVEVLTLNRPDKLNALNPELTAALHSRLDDLTDVFPAVRAIVLTGAGAGFCAGADVVQMAGDLDAPPPSHLPPRSQRLVFLAGRLRGMPQPVIAAVNGIAAGAGLALAVAADLRVASTVARFSSIFVKRAMVPDTAVTYTLPQLLGPALANEMTLTGRIYDATWARAAGLVGSVVDPDELLPCALSLAEEIAANPPVAVMKTKQIMRGVTRDLFEVAETESLANRSFRNSNDRREALQAFLEKRPPVYRGD